MERSVVRARGSDNNADKALAGWQAKSEEIDNVSCALYSSVLAMYSTTESTPGETLLVL